jgi:hypothetical protein
MPAQRIEQTATHLCPRLAPICSGTRALRASLDLGGPRGLRVLVGISVQAGKQLSCELRPFPGLEHERIPEQSFGLFGHGGEGRPSGAVQQTLPGVTRQPPAHFPLDRGVPLRRPASWRIPRWRAPLTRAFGREASMRRFRIVNFSFTTMVAFSSGYGDGVYTVMLGIDPFDNPAVVLVDFEVVPDPSLASRSPSNRLQLPATSRYLSNFIAARRPTAIGRPSSDRAGGD